MMIICFTFLLITDTMKMFLIMAMLIINNSEHVFDTNCVLKTLLTFKYINLFRIAGICPEIYVISCIGVFLYLYCVKS